MKRSRDGLRALIVETLEKSYGKDEVTIPRELLLEAELYIEGNPLWVDDPQREPNCTLNFEASGLRGYVYSFQRSVDETVFWKWNILKKDGSIVARASVPTTSRIASKIAVRDWFAKNLHKLRKAEMDNIELLVQKYAALAKENPEALKLLDELDVWDRSDADDAMDCMNEIAEVDLKHALSMTDEEQEKVQEVWSLREFFLLVRSDVTGQPVNEWH